MWCLKGHTLRLLILIACLHPGDFSGNASMPQWFLKDVLHGLKPSYVSNYGKSLTQLLYSFLHSIAVRCQETQMVIVIHRDMFGTGHQIQEDDVSIGPQGCRSTGTPDDLLLFEVDLHECSSKIETTPDSLIYHTNLNYNPNFARNPVIAKNSPIEIPIECHYPRKASVSSHAIKPTWTLFNSTMSSENNLFFSLRLMDDNWNAERASTKYRLDDVLRIQADVYGGNKVPLRLFVDSCVATQAPGKDSIPTYEIIDSHGCLVDGRIYNVPSAFITPRQYQETLQFTIAGFRFSGNASNRIYITCYLRATAADEEPDPFNKACSFNRQWNMWLPVEGSRDICDCCEMGNCPSPEGWPSNTPSTRHIQLMSITPAISDFLKEEIAFDVVAVGPLLILDPQEEQGVIQVEAKGNPAVTEAETDYTIDPTFIPQEDPELMKTPGLENVIPNTTMLDVANEDDTMAANMSTDADVCPRDLTGDASETQEVSWENVWTIAAGIMLIALVLYIC